MQKISLAIIAKNNQSTIGKLFDSIQGVFDEIVVVDTGSTDDTKKIAAQYGAKLYDFPWCDDFSKARQFAFDQTTHDWVMWLDTDDTVRDAKHIKNLVEQIQGKAIGIAFPYEYAFDEAGNCTTLLYRERIVLKSEFQWVGRVHEVLVRKRSSGQVWRNKEVSVVHHLNSSHNEDKSARNLKLLLLQLKDEQTIGKPDPRTLFYIGNTYFGMQEYQKARDYYYAYCKHSGWGQELYAAWIRLAIIERTLGDMQQSVFCATQAWQLFPSFPDAYVHMGWTYSSLENWKQSNEYLELAMKMEAPKWDTAYNPRDYDVNPLKLMANNYIQLGKLGQAISCHEKVLKINKYDDASTKILPELRRMKSEHDRAQSYWDRYTKVRGDQAKVRALYESIPKALRSYPSIVKIKHDFDRKETSTGKDIAIFCGGTVEEWTPDSVKTGIGGSEEAVINMGNQLTKLGYHVTVYNQIFEAKQFNGVWYRPWYEYNQNDLWDYLIGWRNVELFEANHRAKRKYLWLHDLINPDDYTEARLKNIDKIIVLSEYHKEPLKHLPAEQFFVTSNGVDVSLFNGPQPKRDPYKMIWTSSYDRGLEHLLNFWPEILRKYPKATLHICYGWGGFDAQWGNNPERMAWKRAITEKMARLEGVYELGRISHKEVAQEMLSSNIWPYSSTWLETNCITALKAQIAGAIPVSTTLGALNETVKYGIKVDADLTTDEGRRRYFNALLDTLSKVGEFEEQRTLMRTTIATQYSWEAIAKTWDVQLFNN